ncbi:hypothetical protein [Streptomyces sp. FH025]|uniref:hypothetical protein n=1 Tax=Streptomyces sp. FH025 TaxID=2815937 RepID=UPI001A9EC2B7|nr:hypothetical protein [Streptomyces sp. FH025]MBO1415088.1 hypothetical protein [Streptomyces sp. FH025]
MGKHGGGPGSDGPGKAGGGSGGGHSGKPDTAPHDGQRDAPPTNLPKPSKP